MHVLQTLWETFWTALGWIGKIIAAIGSYMGIDGLVAKNALTIIIVLVLSTGPFVVSKSEKRKVKKIAGMIVDTVSFLKK